MSELTTIKKFTSKLPFQLMLLLLASTLLLGCTNSDTIIINQAKGTDWNSDSNVLTIRGNVLMNSPDNNTWICGPGDDGNFVCELK